VYLLAFWPSHAGNISLALGAGTSSIHYDLLNRLLRGPGAGHHLRLDLNAAVDVGNLSPACIRTTPRYLRNGAYASMCNPALLPAARPSEPLSHE
jgi:hypothetical protein